MKLSSFIKKKKSTKEKAMCLTASFLIAAAQGSEQSWTLEQMMCCDSSQTLIDGIKPERLVIKLLQLSFICVLYISTTTTLCNCASEQWVMLECVTPVNAWKPDTYSM